MLIDVAKIRKAFGSSETYRFRKELRPLDALKFTGPVEVEVSVTNVGHSILLKGTARAGTELDCSRCLEPFKLDVEAEFEEEICHASDVSAFLADNPEAVEEETFTVFSADELDIGPLVEEHILLALPMKPLCLEVCKGLCPQCGRNLNQEHCDCVQDTIDPRLAKLAKFFDSDK